MKPDDLVKAVDEHLRIHEISQGIFVLEPHCGDVGTIRSPLGQIRLIHESLPLLKERLGFKTILWDSGSTTARQCVREIAESKSNANDKSKHYEIFNPYKKGDVFVNTPGVNWNDNGMAQNTMRYEVRDKLLKSSVDFHYLLLGHEVYDKTQKVMGFDAGGPAAAADFGHEFTRYWRFGLDAKDPSKRVLHTQPFKEGGKNFRCKTNDSPMIKGRTNILIPEGDYDGCVKIWEELMGRVRLMRVGYFGPSGSGKTSFASAFLGLPNTLPVLVVMSDNQPELSSWWPQIFDIQGA